jgi:hypothetical protein
VYKNTFCHETLVAWKSYLFSGAQKKDRILKEMGVEDYLKEKK